MSPSLFLAGGAGQDISVHKASRSPLSGIPVRTTPAAAVSPMQVSEPTAWGGGGRAGVTWYPGNKREPKTSGFIFLRHKEHFFSTPKIIIMKLSLKIAF